MHNTQAYIDFSTNTLSICDGLVFENVISNSTPTNAIYPKSKCVIPPSSEAIIPVHSKDSVDGLYVVEPLPALPRHHVSLAHAVVSLNNHQTFGRILNPSPTPAILTKRTALATITPIPDDNVYNYEQSQTPPPCPAVDRST